MGKHLESLECFSEPVQGHVVRRCFTPKPTIPPLKPSPCVNSLTSEPIPWKTTKNNMSFENLFFAFFVLWRSTSPLKSFFKRAMMMSSYCLASDPLQDPENHSIRSRGALDTVRGPWLSHMRHTVPGPSKHLHSRKWVPGPDRPFVQKGYDPKYETGTPGAPLSKV